MARLRWGVLGYGAIARKFADAQVTAERGTLAGIGTRNPAAAARIAEDRPDVAVHDYQGLLDSREVEAVYIATPHPFHARWAIAAAEAGKHVLCEKPLGLNHAESMAIVEAAHRAGVFLMEAFMYRTHPQTARLLELLRQGTIGEVRMVEASFGYATTAGDAERQVHPELGGGAILDVGCYTMSMARLVAGVATDRPFADPASLTGRARFGANGVDDLALATAEFPGGIAAALACSIRTRLANEVRIMGTTGILTVHAPWFAGGVGGGQSTLSVRRPDGSSEAITIDEPRHLYAIEADAVAGAIAEGRTQHPALGWDDTLGNMRALDQWRAAVGLEYPMETPARQVRPVHGRSLARRGDARMRFGRIEGLDKQLSRLALGSIMMRPMPFAAAMLDDFYERGGNVIETAFKYGGGKSEEMIGHWLRNRGVRNDMVLITKGAETPFCHPKDLTEQLLVSLDRLGTERVEIYMMHRDNEEYPVSVWMDLLNEHQQAGRFDIFGVSNWSYQRIDEANAYARAHGLRPISVMSNNFSLARMIAEPWPLCRSASEPDFRAWLARTRMPSFPWSAQARGFFTDRAGPDRREDSELVRCWYSDDNFERRRRAGELADQRGVAMINVALAYVLHQPFPTFPIIGPLSLAEQRSSFAALDVALSPAEVAWLNLETDERR